MRLSIAKASEATYVKGRRDFLTFRDLGFGDASDGRYGAVVINAKESMTESTGWHFHECDVQMLYMLGGWSRMRFEDGTELLLEPGDFLTIPGGTKHNEIETSADLEVLEITSPATMGTVPCDAPDSWAAEAAS